MKWKAFVYLILITATIAGASAMIGTVYRQGSTAVPQWSYLVSPGALSAKHAFLSGQCETCHTPLHGVEASACIACHATDAVTLARQSTAFHSTIQSCAACHVEHQKGVRPIRMEHDALIAIGRSRRLEQAGRPPDA